jgi:23S rRNA-/tRNA-specific pseudouridylate synthase
MPNSHSKTFPFTAELTVENYLSGVRIDSFLVKHFRNYTTFRMQRLIRAANVHSDGIPVEPQQRVFAGQRISIHLTEPPDKLIDPEPLPKWNRRPDGNGKLLGLLQQKNGVTSTTDGKRGQPKQSRNGHWN